jgi:hypothetical protein
MNTLAGISGNVTTVAGISGNVTTVAGIQANVTSVANNATNINAVAADATDIGVVAGKATEIGRLGTADAVADMNTLGTADVVADLNTLGTADVVTDMNTLGTADNVTNMNTVADNISSVNSFVAQYRIASSAPTTSLDEGDLYFNTTANTLNHYNGSAWVIIQSYSVGDGGLSEINFTTADNTKLDGIEALANVTDTTNVVAALTAGTGITISGGGTIAAGPIALTTVQVAANQTAQLALTAEAGDVVVRSDENKSYMHNGGTAGTMGDYTLLATPTDVVLSVDGAVGAVTLNHDSLTGFVANEHLDWTADQGSTNLHANNYTDTVYTHPTGPGYNHIPTGGSAGQVLKYSSSGTAVWGTDNNDAVAMAIALG